MDINSYSYVGNDFGTDGPRDNVKYDHVSIERRVFDSGTIYVVHIFDIHGSNKFYSFRDALEFVAELMEV